MEEIEADALVEGIGQLPKLLLPGMLPPLTKL